MIKRGNFEPVTRFDLARSLPGTFRYWTTAYLVGDTLIDSGCAHCAGELLESLAEKQLAQIINTHTHEDHIGANGILQDRNKGLKIRTHPKALAVLADPRHEQPLHPYRRIFWGWPDPSLAHAVTDGEIIESGAYRFQVIYTPGHSADHICLHEAERGWLFSGDLFVGGQERALRQGYDIWQIIQSLKKIAQLPLRCLFPGAARVRENPGDELHAKITYLEELGGQVLDLYHRGWDVPAITRKLCGAPMTIEWITLGHFSRKHLVLSYLGKYSQ
jgi:glyoxylase-like metal-dependent hydrolase (beta-lactamase superfamily II)